MKGKLPFRKQTIFGSNSSLNTHWLYNFLIINSFTCQMVAIVIHFCSINHLQTECLKQHLLYSTIHSLCRAQHEELSSALLSIKWGQLAAWGQSHLKLCSPTGLAPGLEGSNSQGRVLGLLGHLSLSLCGLSRGLLSIWLLDKTTFLIGRLRAPKRELHLL